MQKECRSFISCFTGGVKSFVMVKNNFDPNLMSCYFMKFKEYLDQFDLQIWTGVSVNNVVNTQ